MSKKNKTTEQVHRISKTRVVYRYTDGRAPGYYVREWFPFAKKNATKTLDTEDLDIAIERAKRIQLEPSGLSKKGTPLPTYGYKFGKVTAARAGQIAELIFEDMMRKQNYEVSKPVVDEYGYDYILGRDNKFYKVQVKSTHQEKGAVNLSTRDGRMYKDLVDYLAYINFEESRLYFMPTEKLPDKSRLPFSELRMYTIDFK